MYIDEITPESGTLFFFECYEFIDQIKDSSKTRSFFKATLRLGITNFVLPIFTQLGIIWNVFFGLIKIPVFFLLRKYQTDAFANQIKAHFSYALLDFVSYIPIHYSPLSQYIPSYQDWHKLHYFWVFGYGLFPKDTVKISEYLRKEIPPPPPPKSLVDPRLLDKPLQY